LLVHASNFRKVKRIGDVIRVFARIREVVPSKLLLIGDGEERQNMELLTRQLGIDEDVRFIGKLEAMEEVLSVADLFLMPSEKESFGLAALEAMACQVPVISSNTGGLSELNIHGVTGFLSNIGDINDMVEKALFVLDEKHLEGFKQRALERAREFDVKVVVSQYEDYYQEVVERFHKERTVSKV
ncbi:MAG: glycosyltransferase, partial [Leadbetterella sp.]|nr:glycosyltransferase [Leadbetterella sp.]